MREFRSRAPGGPVGSVLVNDGSYISATTGELRGIPAAEPILRLTFDVEAGGLSDGASALFLITGSVQADAGPHPEPRHRGPRPEAARLQRQGGRRHPLHDAGRRRMDAVGHRDRADREDPRRRERDDLPELPVRADQPGNRHARLAAAPAADQGAVPGQPTAVRVDAHQWVKDVLEQWQLAAAVSLVVAIPAGTATDEHRTIVSRLSTAKQRLTAGTPDDLKASVAASREACELLRKMRPAAVNPVRRSSAISPSERPSSSTR